MCNINMVNVAKEIKKDFITKYIKNTENFSDMLDKSSSDYKKDVVGVYGFFAKKENKEYCFYLGKSVGIFYRVLQEHLCRNFSKGWYIYDRILEYINDGYDIEVRILVSANVLPKSNLNLIVNNENLIEVNMKKNDIHWI